MVHALWQQFPAINRKLNDLTQYLTTTVHSGNTEIDQQVTGLLTNGGKLLRPGLFYMFAQLGPVQDEKRQRAAAAAIELLHVATLIHDDVLDDAELRHGQPTLQVRHGNKTAIYTGDFLFTSYFDEILKATDSHAEIQSANDIMRFILAGELNQLALNFDPQTTVTDYLTEIEGKTARLFGFAMQFGVVISKGTSSEAKVAQQIGIALGMAYQIRDDILDYVANPSTATKPVRHDLREGAFTLPLILASQNDPDWFAQHLQDQQHLNDEAIQAITQHVIDLDGPTHAEELAQQYTEKAQSLITTLPEPLSTELSALVSQLLVRHA
ncbi:Heptaprenyl diphosphate synthase component II [Furfurilactobacillus rossiae]|uniref:polyprenyl synthetase family protein n=1 Tax=Furfurilactobacillus rossiae TaxID=231049 RepID=UPI0015B9DB73|nr:polyprenyl synthetase family protein [Furfurilactobacillus rossiae]MCF6165308.1 polyprenyl synthetase family protein [Furfurilactobacillus rossiae]QLE63668.1 Heptaprenyl diphosphate synthase component II [Furfurilactobacillus rossiae]